MQRGVWADGDARLQSGGDLVEDVPPVGARQDDDSLCGAEAVHLHQQLVEGVLPLVVAAAELAAASTAPDGVDLVDEDNAGRLRARLREQVPHTRGAHADEHLQEVAAADGEERHRRLTGHRLGQQRLACRAGTEEQQRRSGEQ